MVWDVRLSEEAHSDIEHVMTYTRDRFGGMQAVRYADLIEMALTDIATQPMQLPARPLRQLGPQVFSLHLSRPGRRASHVLICRVLNDQVIQVARLLHDAMDLELHWHDPGAD